MARAETKAPPYTEAQATRWLSWLARGMQAHGQTVFLIEQLQPSWLAVRWQRVAYVFVSRLGAASLFGLIFGSLEQVGSSFDLSLAVEGFIFGAMIGAAMTIPETLWLETFTVAPSKSTRRTVMIGGLYLLVGALAGAAAGGLEGFPPFDYPEYALVGAVLSLFWVMRILRRSRRNDIQTAEVVVLSWLYLLRGFLQGGLIGLLVGLLLYSTDTALGASFVLLFTLWMAAIGGWVRGFRAGIREQKTLPDQGIRLTVRNAFLRAIPAGISFALIYALAYPVVEMTSGAKVEATLDIGFLSFAILLLWFGAVDVVQHYALRLVLAVCGYAPWNYARFLDYAATELGFLQKVGGGYIFIHRMLLEHFAALPDAQASNAPGEAGARQRL